MRPKTPRIEENQSGSNQPPPVQASFGGSQLPFDGSSTITSQLAPPTPSEMDMSHSYTSQRGQYHPNKVAEQAKRRVQRAKHHANENAVKTYLDLDTLLDASFCTGSMDSQTLLSFFQPGPLGDTPAMNLERQSPTQHADHYLGATMGDDFLSPWRGTLAAAYQASATG